jgi:hypothetical protein
MNAGIFQLLKLVECMENLDLYQMNNVLITICCVISDIEEIVDDTEVRRYIVLDLVYSGVLSFCMKRIALEQENDVGIQFCLEIITRMIVHSGPSCFLLTKETLKDDPNDLLSYINGLLMKKESSFDTIKFHASSINLICALSHSKEGSKVLVSNHLHFIGSILKQYEYSEEVIRLTFLTLWNIAANSTQNGLAIFNSGIFNYIFDKAQEVFNPQELDPNSLSLSVCALMSLSLLPINHWGVTEWCNALIDKNISSGEVPIDYLRISNSTNK